MIKEMRLSKKFMVRENIVYSVWWLFLFLLPVSNYLLIDEASRSVISCILREWVMLVPYVVMFLINENILMPRLLFRKKIRSYLIITLSVVFITAGACSWLEDKLPFTKCTIENVDNKVVPSKNRHLRNNTFLTQESISITPVVDSSNNFPLVIPALGFFVLCVLIIGLNVAVKMVFFSLQLNEDKKEREETLLRTELNYLKFQINPHFFMNTLNNIHALIDIDSVKAKQTIIDFSKMMRHILYETEVGTTTIEDEVSFIENYLGLMSLRFTEKVKVDFRVRNIDSTARIPSLLMMCYIENAFKYGADPVEGSLISILLYCEDKHAVLIVDNDINKKVKPHKDSGIGLANASKRLELLYGNKYLLKITNETNHFNVYLKIPYL